MNSTMADLSHPFWPHHLDFDIDVYGSDLDFAHIVPEDCDGDEIDIDFDSHIFSTRHDTVPGDDEDDAVSEIDDDRENQVSFVMDLLHQRVEQSLPGDDDSLDLGLRLGLGLEIDGDDDFFVAASNGVRVSDEEDYDDGGDDGTTIPLHWDSLQLDDHRDILEDFEWEEIDQPGLRLGNDNYQQQQLEEQEQEEELVLGLESLEWEILLNPDTESEDYTQPLEMFFAQFAENEATMEGPAAGRAAVEGLETVTVTDGALCAVCKDEMVFAKRLPCSHRYHGECIGQWLRIRNTCPVCRHELPTDEAERVR